MAALRAEGRTRTRPTLAWLVAVAVAALVLLTFGHAAAHDQVAHQLIHATGAPAPTPAGQAEPSASPCPPSFAHPPSDHSGHDTSARRHDRTPGTPSGAAHTAAVGCPFVASTATIDAAQVDPPLRRTPSRAALQVWLR